MHEFRRIVLPTGCASPDLSPRYQRLGKSMPSSSRCRYCRSTLSPSEREPPDCPRHPPRRDSSVGRSPRLSFQPLSARGAAYSILSIRRYGISIITLRISPAPLTRSDGRKPHMAPRLDFATLSHQRKLQRSVCWRRRSSSSLYSNLIVTCRKIKPW